MMLARWLLIGLLALLPACGTLYVPLPSADPALAGTAAKAQAAINEANAMLTAINMAIKEQVGAKTMPPDEAQRWLDRSKALGRRVDELQALVRLGEADLRDIEAQKRLIFELQRELRARIGDRS
ncbi:MAG: hypothetical protein KatS3mg082_1792 [Nitrospiraceae bacterium]|nr:MAG: hypothetical protein KatS3mg082_1792 [Nitrospiraceae bacterium]